MSIVSTGSGTGNGAATISGTSMASPHAAGVAALTKQAHPTKSSTLRWKVREWKAAIINTADPAGVLGYRTSRGGSGLVQPALSTKTQAVAFSAKGLGVSLNFGYAELKHDYSKTLTLKIENLSPHSGDVQRLLGAPERVSSLGCRSTRRPSSCPVRALSSIHVTLNVPAATAGASNGAGLSFQEVAGLVDAHAAGSGVQQRHHASRPVLPRPACPLGHQDEAG